MKKILAFEQLGSNEFDKNVVSEKLYDKLKRRDFDIIIKDSDFETKFDFYKHIAEIIDNYSDFELYGFTSYLFEMIDCVSKKAFRTFLNTDETDYFEQNGVDYENLSVYDDQIDIVIPVYNNEKTIRESIESVLNQTHSNFRLFIVNDGSNDNSGSIVKSYNDDRIVYIEREHSGISKSLNYVISYGNAHYIARQDADDIWMPWHLDLLLFHMKQNPNIDLIGSRVFIDMNKKPGKLESVFIDSIDGDDLWSQLAYRNIFNHSATMFKRKAFLDSGSYDSNFDGYEDWHLWSRMLDHSNGLDLDVATVYYFYKLKKHENDLVDDQQQLMFRFRLAKSRGLTLDEVLN